jgi:hypothetical protein
MFTLCQHGDGVFVRVAPTRQVVFESKRIDWQPVDVMLDIESLGEGLTVMANCKLSRNEGYWLGAGREYCGTQLDRVGYFRDFGGLGGCGIRTFFTLGGFVPCVVSHCPP